ncbi:MAG: hypothetical protein IKS09_00535 [Lachnospiraceae bacterium]|nr:hypothetical protein [Lachnospiraceae bacterium]
MKNDDISKEKLAAFFPDTTVSDTFDPAPAKSIQAEDLYQKKNTNTGTTPTKLKIIC